MIVKIHARGSGGGSGPVEYLLGKDGDREGATLDRGNPKEIEELIDSSPYAKKYTSGVLSFAEADLDRKTKDNLMSSFEKALLPGLDADQYSCLWVEHRDKGRLELNFVVPNIELQTGKRLQPYYHRADKPRINAWKVVVNGALDLHDPDNPKNKRELVTSRDLPIIKKDACEAITDGLLNLMDAGKIKNRDDIKNILKEQGFDIARETPKSISISDPEGGRNIRLKGHIYEQDFRFSEKLRGEITAASDRYEADIKERVQQARSVYRKGVEIKRTENERRYPRTESASKMLNIKDMVLDSSYVNQPSFGELGRALLSGEPNKKEFGGHQRTESKDEGIRKIQSQSDHVRRSKLPSATERGGNSRHISGENGQVCNPVEISYDRIRKAAFERIRDFTGTAREATSRLSERVQKIGRNVFHYLEGKQDAQRASKSLERSSVELEQAISKTEVEPQQKVKLKVRGGFER
nr:Mobilization relaxase [Moritella viscosa]